MFESMSPGPSPKLTVDQIVEIMRNASRPVWSVKQFKDRADVSKPTARKWLNEAVDSGEIVETEVAGSSVYYLPGKTMERFENHENPIESDLEAYWNDRFVGDRQEPSVVSTLQGTKLRDGDKGKFLVYGRPGEWDYLEVEPISESIDWIDPQGFAEYNAIITGELYAKPTVPIEHIEYPEYYDLELYIGGEYRQVGSGDRSTLVVSGVENYLVKPCNDALFLQDVAVERVEGPAPELEDTNVVDVEERMRETYLSTLLKRHGEQSSGENK